MEDREGLPKGGATRGASLKEGRQFSEKKTPGREGLVCFVNFHGLRSTKARGGVKGKKKWEGDRSHANQVGQRHNKNGQLKKVQGERGVKNAA